ncbi:adenylosuccinate lyase [candidate division WOR-3 bacterium]|nr:adenylosuccinate lyase [candidate division WOR-3 bacterium]
MIPRYSVEEIDKIWSDDNKFKIWFEVELAVLSAREELGQIPKGTAKSLKGIEVSAERIKEIEKKTRHDVVSFITAVGEKGGDAVRFFHQGLTSSDIGDTSFALQIKECSSIIKKDIDNVLEILKEKALQCKGLPIMGRTHGIHGEPTSLGLKFLTWYSEMKRAIERFETASKKAEYGKISGAMGNFAHLDPEVEEIALRKLNLKPEPISTQVVPRDRYAEYIFALATIGSTIEHISHEIRHLQRTEIRELEEPFKKGQKGSSAMPHKRNPILCERLSGMSRLLRSYLITAVENIILWNERDISHSSTERIYFPDAITLTVYMLRKLAFIIKDINIYKDNIEKNIWLTNGLIFSQKVLIKLLDKGVKRDEAYNIVQENAMEVWQKGGSFKEKIENDKRVKKYLNKKELKNLFDPKSYLKNEEKIFKRVLS